jgi:hypothetical protein
MLTISKNTPILTRRLRFGFIVLFIVARVSFLVVTFSSARQFDAVAIVQTSGLEKPIHELSGRDNPCLAERSNLEKKLFLDKAMLSCCPDKGKLLAVES